MMTRQSIESSRAVLKTYFPNRSEDRALFNLICDTAIRSVRARVAEAAIAAFLAGFILAAVLFFANIEALHAWHWSIFVYREAP
jgi:hypothetical protein